MAFVNPFQSLQPQQSSAASLLRRPTFGGGSMYRRTPQPFQPIRSTAGQSLQYPERALAGGGFGAAFPRSMMPSYQTQNPNMRFQDWFGVGLNSPRQPPPHGVWY